MELTQECIFVVLLVYLWAFFGDRSYLGPDKSYSGGAHAEYEDVFAGHNSCDSSIYAVLPDYWDLHN